MNDNDLRIRDKVMFFYSEKIKVHVEKKDREFLNGTLIKKIKEGVWAFLEDKLGEVYLFEKDIFDIDQFKEARK